MTKTRLKSLEIESFRALKNITIPIANKITVICGKNGTSKSSLLGLAAHGFNFNRDHISGEHLKYESLLSTRFVSLPSEHFRISKDYDTTGSMQVAVHWYDGYTSADQSMKIKLYNSADRDAPRAIVRDNTSVNTSSPSGKNNTSVKATHPVIYLSLKRLLPIAQRFKYDKISDPQFDDYKKDFINISKKILSKTGISEVTKTGGTITSASPHGDNYDHLAVSVGEDNIGQIALSILSFVKLEKEYKNYKGGLLLIDEADAGLFPAAQISLIKTLIKYCKHLNLQVIITSHSPLIIEEIHSMALRGGANAEDYKVVYLTDSYGRLEVKENISWPEIHAELLLKTIEITPNLSLPKINVYCEDSEGHAFLSALIRTRATRSCINPVKKVSLGGNFFISLAESKISEFTTRSIVVLDGDKKGDIAKKLKKIQNNIMTFPADLPPDQLIFEMLYNLESNNVFWRNPYGFTKPVFSRVGSDIITELDLNSDKINLGECIKNASLDKGRTRTLFDIFYKSDEIQQLVNGRVKFNPFRLWVSMNPDLADAFIKKFTGSLQNIYIKAYGISSAKVAFLSEPKK